MLALYMMLLEDEEDKRRVQFLYNTYYGKMVAVAKRYFSNDQRRAEDAVHESFLKIIENFSKISKISCEELPGYLVIIVRNQSIDILRKEKRLVLTDDWMPYERPAEAEPGDVFGRLVSIIRAMPETYRAALEMRFVLEMEHREIARVLGISETAAANRVSRGRELLIEKLLEEGYEHDRTAGT